MTSHRTRRFFAIENPLGIGVLNQSYHPNHLHAFPTVVARDCFVAYDPEHRASIASSSGVVRRLSGELVGGGKFHSSISYLDRS